MSCCEDFFSFTVPFDAIELSDSLNDELFQTSVKY